MTEMVPAATVPVQSGWWSKINWVQIVGGLSAVLVWWKGAAFGIPVDYQNGIAATIPVIMGFGTWILRTFFTKTVTPSSVTPTTSMPAPK